MDTARLETLFAAAQRLGANAIHLVPGRPPALRVQRRFVAVDETALQSSDIEDLTRDMLFSDHRQLLQQHGHVEVLYVARSGMRYRASVTEIERRCAIVMRPVPLSPPKAEELGLPEQVAAMARCRSGLVIVSGAFGAGKSTTLAAIVDACNEDEGRHIVTVEDSIQFVHQNRAALLHQREVGTHVATAVEGVRQAMASGVDVIVIGEVRDEATLDAALSAAESGCLVFAGVEAGSITAALAELSAMVSIEERPRLRTRLASVLRGATGQRLLHRLHKSGRIPVVEVLVASQAVRQVVRGGRLQELAGIMNRCRGLGMQTTDVALRGLLAHHMVTPEEALLHACNPDDVLSRTATR